MLKYALRPGWVTSHADGEDHYINAKDLASLYGLQPGNTLFSTGNNRLSSNSRWVSSNLGPHPPLPTLGWSIRFTRYFKVNKVEFKNLKDTVIARAGQVQDDGWLPVERVGVLLDEWFEAHSQPAQPDMIIGWKAIGAAIGRNPATLAVRHATSGLPVIPHKVGRYPAYTKDEIQQLNSLLSPTVAEVTQITSTVKIKPRQVD